MTREHQTLTVLFADISESSRLYNQLGDSEARSAITACLSALTGVLPAFDGRLVKTLGDAIMCVFPNAAAAVNAATEMQGLVTNDTSGGQPLRLHIGLHAGPVLVEEGDVFGDTVNAAAFLTNVAMAEQILLSDVTEKDLPPYLKPFVRPLFRAMLKGSSGESGIFQVVWRTDNLELTDVNMLASRVLPADAGSLLVVLDETRARVDRWHPLLTLGRDAASDVPVMDQFASRRHCSIRLVRSSFYLVDHSVNGTYVTFASGDEVHLLRGEIVLEGTGEIRLGRSRREGVDSTVLFKRDRRSQFRP
ncbi:MAG TPA: adenylate/guanylate cyclase domain-containing protein [Burkholderiales bacterium]|nr:adenylate/guanylate cyclase domain-containing protein [Burkholderiales bacterium]